MKRFWDKVDKQGENDCWLWTASRKSKNGVKLYGKFMFEGQTISSHRFSWELEYGPIPAGKIILHTCDTPHCVNPKHLKLGTQADNVRDMYRKGRHTLIHTEEHKTKMSCLMQGNQHARKCKN